MRRAGLLLLTALSACTHLERRGGEADLAVCFVATPDLSLDAWDVTEPGAWAVVERRRTAPGSSSLPRRAASPISRRTAPRIASRSCVTWRSEEGTTRARWSSRTSSSPSRPCPRAGATATATCACSSAGRPRTASTTCTSRRAPDANAHNLFLVDGAPRRSLEPVFEEGLGGPTIPGCPSSFAAGPTSSRSMPTAGSCCVPTRPRSPGVGSASGPSTTRAAGGTCVCKAPARGWSGWD